MNPAPSTHRTEDEILSALEAFHKASGFEVCLKLFDPQAAEGSQLSFLRRKWSLHLSPFCLDVKTARTEACRQCDLRDVPERCQRERDIFVFDCHAGASEMIVPLFVEETLAGVCYLGQFRCSGTQPAVLPRLSQEGLRHLKGLAVILRAYLTEQVRSLRFASMTSGSYRGDLIRRFLRGRLKQNPGLPELAVHLGVSPSRVSHIVRETTESSFTELRDSLRLERARELLAYSYSKVAHVAEECGFQDSQYFHRFFRKHTGLTPSQFRRTKRLEA